MRETMPMTAGFPLQNAQMLALLSVISQKTYRLLCRIIYVLELLWGQRPPSGPHSMASSIVSQVSPLLGNLTTQHLSGWAQSWSLFCWYQAQQRFKAAALGGAGFCSSFSDWNWGLKIVLRLWFNLPQWELSFLSHRSHSDSGECLGTINQKR